MKKVLVICSANSCRSIVAEGMINHYLAGKWQGFSAGLQSSSIHPYSRKVLEELGIDTSQMKSESIAEYWHREDLDLIITVCDSAARRCPNFFHPIKRVHIPFPDPINYRARSEEDGLKTFRDMRDKMKIEIVDWLRNL